MCVQPRSFLECAPSLTVVLGWDALFFGEFRDLDQDEFPPSEAGRAIGQTTYSFHRRGAAEAFKDMERSKRYMLQMVGRIRFGIWHDRTNTLSQLSSGNLGICGQTERSALYPWISVNISNHHVGRLLREDLNVSVSASKTCSGHLKSFSMHIQACCG